MSVPRSFAGSRRSPDGGNATAPGTFPRMSGGSRLQDASAVRTLFGRGSSAENTALENQVTALLADPANGDGPDRDEMLRMQGKLSEQREALSTLMEQKRQLEALQSQMHNLADADDAGDGGSGGGGGGGGDGDGTAASGSIEELLAGFMNVFQSDPAALSSLGQALDLGGNGNDGDNHRTTIEELTDDASAEQDETKRSPRVRFESPPSKEGAASTSTSTSTSSPRAGDGSDNVEGSISLPSQFANIPSQELLQAALQDDDVAAELVSAGLDPKVLDQLGEQQAELADLQRQLAEVRKLSVMMDAQHAAGGHNIAAAITDGGGIEAMLEASPAEAEAEAEAEAALQAGVPAATMQDDDPQGTEALQDQLAQLLQMRQHAESLAGRFKELEQAEQELPPGAELPQEDMHAALQLMEELKALRTEGTFAAGTFADEIGAGAGLPEDDQEWRRHRPPMPRSPPPEPPVSMSALWGQQHHAPQQRAKTPEEAEEERLILQFEEQDARVASLRQEQAALQAERDRLVSEREARDNSVSERRMQLQELQSQKAKLQALRQQLSDVNGAAATDEYDDEIEDGSSNDSRGSVELPAQPRREEENGIEDAGALDDLERRLDALHAMTSTMQARSDQVGVSSEQAALLSDVQEKRAMLESLQLQLAQLREMQNGAESGPGPNDESEGGAGDNEDEDATDEDDADADTLGSDDREMYQPGGSSAVPPAGADAGSVEVPEFVGQMAAMLNALRGAQSGLEEDQAVAHDEDAENAAVLAEYEAQLAEQRKLYATLESLKEKKELLQQLKDEEEQEQAAGLVEDYRSEEEQGTDGANTEGGEGGSGMTDDGEEQVAQLLAKLAEQQQTLRALHAMRDDVDAGYGDDGAPAGLTASEMADLASDIATLGSAPGSVSGANGGGRSSTAASEYGSLYKGGTVGGNNADGSGGGMMEELSAIRQYMASINQRLIKIETDSSDPEAAPIREHRRVPLMVGRAVFTGGPVNAANGTVKPEESVMAEDGSIKAAPHGVSIDVGEDGVSEVWEETDGDDVFDDDVDGDVGQMSVQNMKLAVLFSEGLPELERKAFFEDFFEFSADGRTSHMAFQLSMEMANKRKLRLHDGRLQFVEQAAPIDPPPEMVHISAPGRGEIEAIMTHDEIDALKERRWHASGGRGTVTSLAATVGSRTMSDTGSEYIDNLHGQHHHGQARRDYRHHHGHQHGHQHQHTITPAAEEAEDAGEEADAVFAALRSTIYREVAVVIAYNESRPNFLVRFFRLLQCLTSDYIRDRALVLMQELVASVLPDDDEDVDEDEDVDSRIADDHMRQRLAAAMDKAGMGYAAEGPSHDGRDASGPGSMAAMRGLSDLGEMTADDSFMWEEEEHALFKVPMPGNPLVRHRSYDYAEMADVGTDIPTPDATEDEAAAEYNWIRREDRERAAASAVSTSEMELETESGAAASLAEEFQQDIEGNQSVLLGVAQYLESLSGSNGVLTEAVITNVAEVILQQTTVTSYLQSVGGDQPDVDQLRVTLNDSLKKYKGSPIESVQADVLRDVGDILYDEMIFYKVISQVDQSYSDEIAGLEQREKQATQEARQLQSQRKEDISKLLLERQRRLAKIVSVGQQDGQEGQEGQEGQATLSPVKESTGSAPAEDTDVSVVAVELTQSELQLASEGDDQVVLGDLPVKLTIPSGADGEASYALQYLQNLSVEHQLVDSEEDVQSRRIEGAASNAN